MADKNVTIDLSRWGNHEPSLKKTKKSLYTVTIYWTGEMWNNQIASSLFSTKSKKCLFFFVVVVVVVVGITTPLTGKKGETMAL
jgi:hypothetical protein